MSVLTDIDLMLGLYMTPLVSWSRPSARAIVCDTVDAMLRPSRADAKCGRLLFVFSCVKG